MKNIVLILISLVAAAHAQHTHIAAGAASTNANTPLQFSSGYSAATVYHLLVKPVGQRYGGYYSLDEQTRTTFPNDYFSFIALSDGQAQPDGPLHAATGSELWMEIASVTGPPGAHFAFWDENRSFTATTPTATFETGKSTGGYLFQLSEPIGDGDPFGHVHNRGWTVDVPGNYVIGFRIRDVNGIHTPSPIYTFNFQAVAPTSYTSYASLLPSAKSTFTADADADGVPNGLEHALGTASTLNSTVQGLGALPAASLTGTGTTAKLKLDFQIASPLTADITLIVQASSDLTTWTTIATKTGAGAWSGTATIAQGTVSNGRIPVTITDPLTIGTAGPLRTLRLRASTP